MPYSYPLRALGSESTQHSQGPRKYGFMYDVPGFLKLGHVGGEAKRIIREAFSRAALLVVCASSFFAGLRSQTSDSAGFKGLGFKGQSL